MSDKKRARSSNFEKHEIILLTELVTKYKSIIENKKTDAVTNKDKDKVWNIIATTFNAASATERTTKCLRLKYEALKKGTKKKMTVHRQELYKTGGGPFAAPQLDIIEEKVLAICSNMSGLEARNDSDNYSGVANKTAAVTLGKLEIEGAHLSTDRQSLESSDITMPALNNAEDGMIEMEEAINEPDDFGVNQNSMMYGDIPIDLNDATNHQETLKDSQHKWSSWNPKALKTKMSQALKPTKASVTSKLDQLSDARLELVQLQRDIAVNEHIFAQKEHELKMQNLHNEEKRKQELHELMLVSMQRQNSN